MPKGVVTDTVSCRKRSEIMSRVRSKDTKPEVFVRSALHRMGYRFRIHRKDLPGNPDMVLPKHRTVIFVHGCFWHQHPGCRKATVPRTLLDEPGEVAKPVADEDAGFLWGTVAFPEPPRREQDFADVVEWEAGLWWSRERVERALSEMGPLHRARVQEMADAGVRRAATAYRRRRNGKSVYEVRSDSVAGCLRTARGGSSTQLVIVAERGEVRMRKMTPREYARLQGCRYQEELDTFPESDLRTAFGDAVCVPAVQWVAEHAFGPVLDALADASADARSERAS